MLGKWPESVHWGLPEAMLLRAARSEDLLRPTLAPLSQCGCRPALLYRSPLQRGPWRAAHQGPQHSSSRIDATPTDVFVVDFDGVLCNTEPELSISGYRSAAKYWPEIFADVDSVKQSHILDALARLRPVLIQGYEAMVMARLILEDPASEERMLQQWDRLLPQVLQRWNVDSGHLSAFSDGYRNACLLKDRHAWTHKNQLFVGVYEALRSCEYPWYVASSKAAHRISALMGSLLGIDLPPDSPRLFASLVPPEDSKVEALRTISQRPLVKESKARVHFIDDRYETVKAVRDAPELQNVVVYLAEWGYNTDAERRQAQQMKGVQLLSLTDFCELLRWGIIMGVGDGCEPSMEEVAAGVAR